MNPKTSTVTLRKCELCGFRFSQFHHFFPKTRNSELTGSKSGIHLCPNHHQMANILQLEIGRFCHTRLCGPDELRPSDFQHLDVFFDEVFKKKILDLIMGYDWGCREHLAHVGYYNEADYE